MGHTFGVFTNSQKSVTFGKMKAQIVDGIENPNNPENPESPNKPRVPRYPGEQSPLLGDDGKGKIGRFQTINIDALEVVIEQIIEQYLRDKTWYGKVRCREALWNMYHRLEWWVKQQVDPSRNDYQRALQMMKDCINHILTEAQDNVSLPLCPAPYYMPFHGDYFNHYDGTDTEVKLFDSRDLPVSDDFPGLFRYVSSAEDQEWELVHATGTDEMQGTETILKLSLNRLLYGNSSKVTFNWRFKKRGFIRFKYMASTASGNGLTFFINNNQVGGEWHQNTGWQEVKFSVQPGQTYKFDWLARKQNEQPWGNEAIYIKDIECVEVIRSLEAPTPPDYDTLGQAAYGDGRYEWITYSRSSVIRTRFDGVVSEYNRTRSLSFDMNSECDGTVSFAYRMNVAAPTLVREDYLFYNDDLLHQTQHKIGNHGSTMDMSHDGQWSGDGTKFETLKDSAKITYELTVGPSCLVDIRGTLEVVCPIREIDHYETADIQNIAGAVWTQSGQWQRTADTFSITDPVQGTNDLSTSVTLEDDGWFTFTFDHDLRPSESLQVFVDGNLGFYSAGQRAETSKIALSAGSHTITFRLQDDFTEVPLQDTITKTYFYGRANTGRTFTTMAPLGSSHTITRNWNVTDTGAETFTDGQTIQYQIKLNPGASFSQTEELEFMPNPNNAGATTNVFTADFNTENDPQGVSFAGSWDWQDILVRQHSGSGDGVYKVEGAAGDHTASVYVSAPMGGKVSFEYGGKYGTYDYMELRIGSTRIWQGHSSSGTQAQTVTVSLPAGYYYLTWIYHCETSGTIITPPSDTGPRPENPNNEVCYPSGSSIATAVDYNLYSKPLTTNQRGTKFGWGGTNFYVSSTIHAAEADGAVITRDITPSTIETPTFVEEIQVQAGRGVTQPVLKELVESFRTDLNGDRIPGAWFTGGTPTKNIVYDQYTMTNYRMTLAGAGLGKEFGAETRYFETNGQIKLNFEYRTHLENKNPIYGRTSKPGQEARYHGEFNLYLVNEAGVATRYLHVTKDANDIFRLNTVVSPGMYKIRVTMKDTVDDYDMDDQGNYYGAWFGRIGVDVQTNETYNDDDGTRVKIELLDKSTGNVLQTSYATRPQSWVNFALWQGRAYQVRYTLEKGKGTTGGLYGRGGSFSLANGRVDEHWSAYCTSNGKYYPASDSTQHPPDLGTPVEVPATEGAWSWIDAIKVFTADSPICADTRLEVKITDSSTVISSRMYTNHDAAETVRMDIRNDTDAVKTYSIVQTFRSSCGDGARLRNGVYTINDNLPPPPSHVVINGYTATNNKPIWIGGCDPDSAVSVTLIDANGIALNRTYYSGGGFHTFGVSDLSVQPYSKYTMVIETYQRGVTSEYTGKKYLTTFRLVDYKAYEKWDNVPDPFNGKLEFFINGALQGTYTGTGGFYEVSYPISKGTNNLKWVFTELGDGNSYDQCEIDFLKLTNWICDKVKVVPYCKPGGGDKCVEELIKCLLKMWNDRPKACVIGKTVWLFT